MKNTEAKRKRGGGGGGGGREKMEREREATDGSHTCEVEGVKKKRLDHV